MSDLIPSNDKIKYDKIFDDIHDTFAREITIFKKEKKSIFDIDPHVKSPTMISPFNGSRLTKVSYVPICVAFVVSSTLVLICVCVIVFAPSIKSKLLVHSIVKSPVTFLIYELIPSW